MSNASSFAESVMALADEVEPFKPVARYDRDGDCVEFFAKPDGFYAQRVDDRVTVYCSQETGEIVGSLIKGVSIFYRDAVRQFPGLVNEVHDGRVPLEHLFRAHLWSGAAPEAMQVIQYRKLMEVAEISGAEAAVLT